MLLCLPELPVADESSRKREAEKSSPPPSSLPFGRDAGRSFDFLVLGFSATLRASVQRPRFPTRPFFAVGRGAFLDVGPAVIASPCPIAASAPSSPRAVPSSGPPRRYSEGPGTWTARLRCCALWRPQRNCLCSSIPGGYPRSHVDLLGGRRSSGPRSGNTHLSTPNTVQRTENPFSCLSSGFPGCNGSSSVCTLAVSGTSFWIGTGTFRRNEICVSGRSGFCALRRNGICVSSSCLCPCGVTFPVGGTPFVVVCPFPALGVLP